MKEKNEKKKRVVRGGYRVLTLVLAFISSSMLWYTNFHTRWVDVTRGTIGTICVGLLYCVVYWFFAKLYRANKIGIYRLTEGHKEFWALVFNRCSKEDY